MSSFYAHRSQMRKKRQSSWQCCLALLGPMSVKAARKTLVKLTPGVNFINIIHTNFLYKCHFGSFLYLHVTREELPKQCSYKKFVRKMLMKLTTGAILPNLFIPNPIIFTFFTTKISHFMVNATSLVL